MIKANISDDDKKNLKIRAIKENVTVQELIGRVIKACLKSNKKIVGNQYEIREIVILNWIEHYTADEQEREYMRMNLQVYLQQEIWVDLEGMKLKDIRE